MSREPVIVYRPVAPPGGRLEVEPAFAAGFAAMDIDSPAGFLDLPGEVVSGHPDRHVLRVELPGFSSAFYLKRQHRVTWRERLRNWRAGFGWVSRCEREAAILKQLAAAGLPGPIWAAVGNDGRGRAFLLIEEAADSADLRQMLSDIELSPRQRACLANRLGQLIARVHSAGFTTPDLTAKHILLAPGNEDITLIDWQAAQRLRNHGSAGGSPSWASLRSLAALHASVANELASPRERLRVLHAALRPEREAGHIRGRFSNLVRRVTAEANRLSSRRSIRDQRHAVTRDQRLVWVAGEAVCAIPEVAANWPTPAIAAPYYSCGPGSLPIQLPGGLDAQLIRGRSFDPIGRLKARLRGRPWRSPGVTLGRVLFHLERYGVPAPRLLAFGQRLTDPATAEWFALHVTPPEPITDVSGNIAERLGSLLRQLHDASCRPEGDQLAVFGLDETDICVRDVTAIRIVRGLTDRDRKHDCRRLMRILGPANRFAFEAGYLGKSKSEQPESDRLIPVEVR